MTKNPSCPSRSELSALVLGKLAPESIDRVAKHVDTCLDCRSALDTVGPDDSLVAQIKRSPPVDDFIREPEFRRGVEQLRAMKLAKPVSAELTTTVGWQSVDSAIQHRRTEPPGNRPGSDCETKLLGLPEQFGRYRILRCLGKGGMGAVYLAHDSQLDRQVAVKVPTFTADAGADLMERFYQEARAAATLNHPNICPVHDVGEIDGVHYLVMAYIDGSPLSKYIKPDKVIPPQQIAVIIRKLALALQDAHDRGIVHRDLKPANIMVNKRRELIIMDFGLARIVKKSNDDDLRLTRPGDVMGTPAYMSPEQVLGETQAIGPPTDIYALGVIMYELLSGCLPFRGGMGSVLAQIVANEPTPPSSIRPSINPQIEAICLKAMAKSAQDRYASMTDFASALADYMHSSAPAPVTGDQKPQAEPPVNEAFAELAAHATPPLDAARQSSSATARRYSASWIWATAGILVLGLSLWLLQGVIFKVKTNEGTIVVEVDQADAEVLVDGEVITITRPNDQEPVTVRRELGKHELRVTKAGFETYTKKFTLDAGKPEQVKVTLQPNKETAESVPIPGSGQDRLVESSSGSQAVAATTDNASAARLTGKLPVPATARLNQLQRVAREGIKSELASARPEDLSRVAQSFITRVGTLDNPEERFALLDLARDFAAQAGDLVLALDVCQRLDREYLIDAVAVKVRTLQVLARSDVPANARMQFREALVKAGFEALAANNYAVARDVARLYADQKARRPEQLPAGLLPLLQGVSSTSFLEQELERTEAAYNRLPAAAKGADRATNDQEVNTTLGLFAGLFKNDWIKATEFLLAAGEPWRTIAEREEARPNSAAGREAIGDMWWTAADGLEPADAAAAHRRARYWYLGALAQMKPSERQAAATRLQPRIDQVQRTPIRLRVRMTDLSGYHWLRISSDGVQTTNRGGRKITGDIVVNQLRWSDHVAGHRNSGAGRLLPDAIDFTTTQLLYMSNSRWGAVHIGTSPEAIDLTFWHAPTNEKSNFDVVLSVESNGYDLPSRFSEQWEVAYYNLPETTKPLNDNDLWPKLIAAPPADRVKMSTINFVSDASPTDEWRPGAPPSKKVGTEHFAMVATSTWKLPAGKYQVRTYADDGIRVFIDGKLTLDNWRPNGKWHAASEKLQLPAGDHQIRLEYYQITAAAILQFNLMRLDK